MKEIAKEQEERLLLYATYTILYLNDTACFSIQQISKDVAQKDKESKKIYGALLKRNKQYLERINKIVDNKMDYYCDFCTEMDNICDDAYSDFKDSLRNVYKNAGIEDYEYLSKVETMRSMVDLSVEAGRKVINNISIVLPKAKFLENYILNDIKRVSNNFAKWSYRKVPKGIVVDLNDDSETMKKFNELSGCLIDFYSFDKAYRKAIDLELERKKLGK